MYQYRRGILNFTEKKRGLRFRKDSKMDVRNCKGCKRLFNYMGGPVLCESCKEALEKKFTEVRAYIDEHPEASVNKVSEDMDVSVKQIREWVREERLILSTASPDGILCEHCGQPIRSGRFCDKCKAHMTSALQSVTNKPVQQVQKPTHRDDRDRMHFLH